MSDYYADYGDGTQYDTFHDGPALCKCGRQADWDGKTCCYCAD